ncbi:MAG: hypothetical protein GY859_22830 [Desulfobacterales bacterium]|nr:hypothetical protein [Desulfobacterales bacterium]
MSEGMMDGLKGFDIGGVLGYEGGFGEIKGENLNREWTRRDANETKKEMIASREKGMNPDYRRAKT